MNSVRFCHQSKQKVLSSNTFGRAQIRNKKNKGENLFNDDLHPSSHGKSDNRSGNGFGNSSYIESNNYVAVI